MLQKSPTSLPDPSAIAIMISDIFCFDFGSLSNLCKSSATDLIALSSETPKSARLPESVLLSIGIGFGACASTCTDSSKSNSALRILASAISGSSGTLGLMLLTPSDLISTWKRRLKAIGSNLSISEHSMAASPKYFFNASLLGLPLLSVILGIGIYVSYFFFLVFKTVG